MPKKAAFFSSKAYAVDYVRELQEFSGGEGQFSRTNQRFFGAKRPDTAWDAVSPQLHSARWAFCRFLYGKSLMYITLYKPMGSHYRPIFLKFPRHSFRTVWQEVGRSVRSVSCACAYTRDSRIHKIFSVFPSEVNFPEKHLPISFREFSGNFPGAVVPGEVPIRVFPVFSGSSQTGRPLFEANFPAGHAVYGKTEEKKQNLLPARMTRARPYFRRIP